MGFFHDAKRLVKMVMSAPGGTHRHHLYIASSLAGIGVFFWAIIPGETSLRAMEPVKVTPTQQASVGYDASTDWSYRGPEAPENWGVLDKSYSACGSGHIQSPIDIPQHQAVQTLPIQDHYFGTAQFSFKDTGRTWQLTPILNNTVTMNGAEYRLTSVVFHSPSEHTVHGWNYPAEIQLMHTAANGSQLVLAVLIDRKQNVALDAFERVIAASDQKLAQAELILGQFIPKSAQGWSYNGSHTTPPCKEGIKWFVFKDTINFSSSQLAALRKKYPDNNRPIQPINLHRFDVWSKALSH